MDLRRGIVVASLLVSLVPGAAYAHAAYKDSDPKDEASVSSPPSSVWAEYTEPVQEGYLQIYDPCGVQVDNGNTQVTGYRMTVGMSADRAGTYAVRWKAASAVDPHVTSGTFTFTVTDGETCPSEEDTEEEAAAPDEDSSDGTNEVSQDGSSDDRSRAGDPGATGPSSADDRTAAGNGIRERRERARVSEAGDDDEITLAQSSPSSEEGGIWDGIPLGGFLMAMAIAAAIGAAGGRIYANIMGPRR